jgi:hypothetical protein
LESGGVVEEDNAETALQEVVGGDMDRQWDVVNAVMNLSVS